MLSSKIPNPKNGVGVPLKSIVKVISEKGPSSIQRLNGLRTISVFAEVQDKVISGKKANQILKPFLEKLSLEFPTVKIETGGGEKDRIKTLKQTGQLYLLALFLIFVTISLSFRSVVYPFLVLLTIPMGICGVIWALTIHNQPLSLMSMIGIVGLSGVVVNVSIILLKYIQERIHHGIDFMDAIKEACVRRLRPIGITTITTLTGLLPTIYGIGGVDTFVQPIALVLGWGLFVATILTLLTLPALISLTGGVLKKI